jgi:hypothetical protein
MQDKTWFNYQGTTTNVILMMSLWRTWNRENRYCSWHFFFFLFTPLNPHLWFLPVCYSLLIWLLHYFPFTPITWIPEPIFMKLGMYIMAPEPIWWCTS